MSLSSIRLNFGKEINNNIKGYEDNRNVIQTILYDTDDCLCLVKSAIAQINAAS